MTKLKSQSHFYAVIMAGGSGTRLWPISRKNNPKQFQALTGKKSLLQQTFQRVRRVLPSKHIFISLGEKYLPAARRQLPRLAKKNFILEPVGRNTAPAIALAALTIQQQDPKAIVATLASDHEVQKEDNFSQDLALAFKIIQKHPQFLMTIGLKPTYPETGYGYIKLGKIFQSGKRQSIYRVDKFIEKPDKKTAQKYFDSLQYLWNASYFIFQTKHILNLFKKHHPKIFQVLNQIRPALADYPTVKKLFQKMPNEPIDTAIIEKTKQILVIPADLNWSDVGSWKSVYEVLKQKLGKSEISQGHHIGHQDKNLFVLGHKKMIATVGLTNIAIIDTPDVTLIINQDAAQGVKKIIEKLKKEGQTKYL